MHIYGGKGRWSRVERDLRCIFTGGSLTSSGLAPWARAERRTGSKEDDHGGAVMRLHAWNMRPIVAMVTGFCSWCGCLTWVFSELISRGCARSSEWRDVLCNAVSWLWWISCSLIDGISVVGLQKKRESGGMSERHEKKGRFICKLDDWGGRHKEIAEEGSRKEY